MRRDYVSAAAWWHGRICAIISRSSRRSLAPGVVLLFPVVGFSRGVIWVLFLFWSSS